MSCSVTIMPFLNAKLKQIFICFLDIPVRSKISKRLLFAVRARFVFYVACFVMQMSEGGLEPKERRSPQQSKKFVI